MHIINTRHFNLKPEWKFTLSVMCCANVLEYFGVVCISSMATFLRTLSGSSKTLVQNNAVINLQANSLSIAICMHSKIDQKLKSNLLLTHLQVRTHLHMIIQNLTLKPTSQPTSLETSLPWDISASPFCHIPGKATPAALGHPNKIS